MTLFVLNCLDIPGGLDLRLATREAHLAYLAAHAAIVKLAGPVLDDDDKPMGSMLVIETADQAAAARFAADDPYALAGLFESVTVRPWRKVIGDFA